ncbi:hypothetical protein G7Z17_g4304 [Cylindrodendrum hubeiense]|uniref:Uncharacterized protein n=1 Tax=Cylindrodendrum hubeiense TaxID=595255 RepID=A0A9P5LCR3_9HYPO|nr:hypothetical protein G7Z17_g4304 [Cylindrodendrum hubeiense]
MQGRPTTAGDLPAIDTEPEPWQRREGRIKRVRPEALSRFPASGFRMLAGAPWRARSPVATACDPSVIGWPPSSASGQLRPEPRRDQRGSTAYMQHRGVAIGIHSWLEVQDTPFPGSSKYCGCRPAERSNAEPLVKNEWSTQEQTAAAGTSFTTPGVVDSLPVRGSYLGHPQPQGSIAITVYIGVAAGFLAQLPISPISCTEARAKPPNTVMPGRRAGANPGLMRSSQSPQALGLIESCRE